MNNKLLLLIFSLFILTSLVSATLCEDEPFIYSGESCIIQLDEPYEYYSIVGNSTEIDLNVTNEGNNITIQLSKYSEEDDFDIVFFNKEKEIIYKSSGGGSESGGGTRIIYRDKNVTEYIYVNETDNETGQDEVDDEGFSPFEKILRVIAITIGGTGIFIGGISIIYYLIFQKRKDRIERGLENGKTKKEI